MARFSYKTLSQENAKANFKVWILAHPDDYELYLNKTIDDILIPCIEQNFDLNCEFWYDKYPSEDCKKEELFSAFIGTDLLVIPVTTKMLLSDPLLQNAELAYSLRNNIPIISLIMEKDIERLYKEMFICIESLDATEGAEDFLLHNKEKLINIIFTALSKSGNVELDNIVDKLSKEEYYNNHLENFEESARKIQQSDGKISFVPDEFREGLKHAKKGEHAIARECFLEALKKFKPLRDQLGDLSNRIFIFIYNNLGYSYAHLGEYAEAVKSFEAAVSYMVAIKDDLDESERNVLFVHLHLIGEIYSKSGDILNSEKTLRRSMDLCKYFIEKNPSAKLFINLSGIYGDLSNLCRDYHNHEGEESFLEKRIQTCRELVEFEESDDTKLELAVAYADAAFYYKEQNILYKSEELYLMVVDITEDLTLKTRNDRMIRMLTIAYSEAAAIKAERNDFESAKKYYSNAIALGEEYVGMTGNIKAKKSLAFHYYGLGSVFSKTSNSEEAINQYLKSFEILKQLTMVAPDIYTSELLARVLCCLGEEENKFKAVDYYNASLQIYQSLYKTNPDDEYYLGMINTITSRLFDLGFFNNNSGHSDELSLLRAIEGKSPESIHKSAESYLKVGNTHLSVGNIETAKENYGKAVFIWTELVKLYPDDSVFSESLATATELLESADKPSQTESEDNKSDSKPSFFAKLFKRKKK